MSITHWQEGWTLGIDLIDSEHRVLVDRLNDLAVHFTAALPDGGDQGWESPGVTPGPEGGATLIGHAGLIAALEGLGELAREHFHHEEALMRAIDYPGLGAHSSEHSLLMAEYIEMVRDLARQSVTQLDAETIVCLRHWLVGHMVGSDKDYATYYFTILGQGGPSAPDS